MTEKTCPAGETVLIFVKPIVAALPRSRDVRRLFPGNLVQRRDYTRVSAPVKSKCQNVTILHAPLEMAEAETALTGCLLGGCAAGDFGLDKTFRHGLASAPLAESFR